MSFGINILGAKVELRRLHVSMVLFPSRLVRLSQSLRFRSYGYLNKNLKNLTCYFNEQGLLLTELLEYSCLSGYNKIQYSAHMLTNGSELPKNIKLNFHLNNNTLLIRKLMKIFQM